MELAVVVGHSRLFSVAETRDDSHYPDDPVVGHEELRGDILAQTDGNVYGCEPEVAAQTVENPAQA